MRNFEHVPAPTTEEAVQQLSVVTSDPNERPRAIAGGTDLLDEMKEGLVAPKRLVNLKANQALRYLRFGSKEGLRVGALTTLSELEENGDMKRRYPAVAAAVRSIASPQIRNMATVGGNLCQRPRCWYYRDKDLHCARKRGPTCYALDGENTYHAILGGSLCVIVHPSDLAPALIAHQARITYLGLGGRVTVPLEEFFIGPDVDITRENVLAQNDVVEEISVPTPPSGTRGVFLKVRDRASWDFATVSVTAVLSMKGGVCTRGRLVLGAVAPVPWPVPEADKLLEGQRITPELADRVADVALEGASPLRHNAYKVTLAKNLVRRALLEAAG